MKTLEILSVQAVMQPFGWVLIHSLWQGAIIASFLRATLILMRKNTANVRYVAACVALLFMVVLPIGTVWMGASGSLTTVSNSAQAEITSSTTANLWDLPKDLTSVQTATPLPAWKHRFEQQLETALPWVVLAWLVGVLFSGFRLYRAWVYTRRLVRSETQLILKQWQLRLEHLA